MSEKNPFFDLPVMQGENLILRPLGQEDSEALYQAASDPLIWEQHPDPERYKREQFEKNFLSGALASGSSLLVIDKITARIVGCSRYYEWDPQRSEVAIGFTFLARSHWGGGSNRELKMLMLDYAFQWAGKVWFHIGKDNWRSRRGTEKVGAVFSHETQKEVNGQLHDYAYYYIARTDHVGATRVGVDRIGDNKG
ncbi:MAG: GNAT family N-acetyltransferase [Pseudohongiella sp.]|nr:GNAT family N-acetyltransferase [Pseudohongiella sp.]MDP2128619.1 GNAT family N-acetyltransferase [Pseudohongiella sp.]